MVILKKRGLSPVIATVLLIALVLVLAIIIFLWARGFISERIEKFSGQAIEDTCAKIDFDADFYMDSSGLPTLEITNRGNVAIYGFAIKQEKDTTDTELSYYTVSVDSGKSAITTLNELDTSSSIVSVVIYPEILGTVIGKTENKPYTCLNQGIKKSL